MTSLCCLQYPAWQRSIVDTAVKAGQFNTLAAALSAGGVTVNNAKVVTDEIAVDNGVIDISSLGMPARYR